ncbi:Inner membrane protein YbcI [Kordia antarctica]|uniref:Inner membrane protein YbcI n=1 Tax=Kordia antarctica TaxID=1218801 RepID=A0A7L4ZRI0_9FLAO|nr:metal-dependent hydrolase [Kordia antarctica]QHI39089.1 Inner membrane protein YbcI [Kordia antarctica]
MASIFGHALAAYTIGKVSNIQLNPVKFSLLLIFCAVIPDADVIMFNFGYPYLHPLGHRGFSHSILFAFLLAFCIRAIFYTKVTYFSNTGIILFFTFLLATLSHSFLDAMTNGGKGVGFFIPFENSRYFFSWRPILVSPLGAGRFFSEKGFRVLQNEAIYIGIPAISLLILNYFMRRKSNRKN